MNIVRANLQDSAIAALIEMHRLAATEGADPSACHALGANSFVADEITLWSLLEQERPVALGALKQLSPKEGEIKTMFTLPECRGRGYARHMLQHLLNQAQEWGQQRVFLETGSWDYFVPARTLYHQFGFAVCEAFADYRSHPDSVYMCKTL